MCVDCVMLCHRYQHSPNRMMYCDRDVGGVRGGMCMRIDKTC